MLQFIRFLRRTEGVEAARKYFLDARKSPNCTYHVYVAYAMMAFCLDKDPKVLFSFLVLIIMYSVFIYKMVLHIDMVGLCLLQKHCITYHDYFYTPSIPCC